jgi:hypothetical protein
VTRKPSQAAATPTATPIAVSARRSIGCCQACCGLTAAATKTTAVVIAAVAASPGDGRADFVQVDSCASVAGKPEFSAMLSLAGQG